MDSVEIEKQITAMKAFQMETAVMAISLALANSKKEDREALLKKLEIAATRADNPFLSMMYTDLVTNLRNVPFRR